MKPLQAIGMGLLIVMLAARFNGFDALPDPLGWVLVLHGATRVRELPLRSSVVAAVSLALAVSIPLWFPGVDGALADRDDSLLWAASLPQIAAVGLLAAALARSAGDAGDRRSARWLQWARTLAVVTALLPVPVLATGATTVGVMLLVGLVTLALTVVLMFRYADRPWAAAVEPARLDQTAGANAPSSP